MKLTWWNQKTYDEVKEYITRGERCAITNATGTGKTSVIAEFIKEFGKNKKILVIAPRKPILDQYLDELYGLENFDIDYITFSMLGKLNKDKELDKEEYKNYGIIVADELHRIGAKTWLPAFDKLILNNPEAYVIGASATPRRLDQRYAEDDMADIVFNGNRCGNFDLKECISQGILPSPIYVSTLYSTDETEEEYLSKIDQLSGKDKAMLKKDIKEALIKWDESKNKEKVIKDFLMFNDMDKRNTKILVFCKNIKHIKQIRKVFDPIFEEQYSEYKLYIDEYHSSSSEKGFEAFKENEEDGVVQILYSVDKFNEGIHIDNLDAIIMLRETQSETIYYQQLGRVLSLSGREHPVIIDIVNNADKVKADEDIRELIDEIYNVPFSEENINDKHIKSKEGIAVGFYNYTRDFTEILHSIEKRLIEKSLYEYKGEKGTYKYFADKYNKDPKIIYRKVKIDKLTMKEAIETSEDLSGITVSYNGISGSLEDVCGKLRINSSLVKYRIENRSMTPEEAIKSVVG